MRTVRQRASAEKFAASLARDSRKRSGSIDDSVRDIIRDVCKAGDAALYRYEKRFGGLQPSSGVPLRLSRDDIASAYGRITTAQRAALRSAAARLAKTERATMGRIRRPVRAVTDRPGRVSITRRFVPLQSVGCYIPGGTARYPSSAIMSIIPAAMAGVKRIVAVSPTASAYGDIDPLTVAAADMCGATEIYRVGGAHAVAALACGTESIRRVDKIVGPGGPYVAAAKSAVSAYVGIDMLAGPTELGIIADSRASARLVALDLISQAEHSADTQCYLITTSEGLAKRVNDMPDREVPRLESRGKIVGASLARNGFVAIVNDNKAAAAVANALAPEHLQVMTQDPSCVAQSITTPGMILLGANLPSAASDYMLGSNHILPTNGSGAARGSLSVLDFVKMLTVAGAADGALEDLQGSMKNLTDAEGLANHYNAVRGRLS